jgi:hypothetical protein
MRALSSSSRKLTFVFVGVVGACVTSSACGASNSGGDDRPDAAFDAAADAPPAVVPLREDVAIDEISVSQAVKITLVKGGVAVAEPNGPVIANRPAYVRVYLQARGAKTPMVSGELRVARAGKADLVLTDLDKRAMLAPEEADERSTLNFTIAAEDMTADAAISFKAGRVLTSTDVVTFPADGSAMPLGAKTSSQTLRVKLVPVTYEAVPGVVLTPSMDTLEAYRQTLYKMYPVATVELSVREPVPWTAAIAANGSGWDALLSKVLETRRADQADRDLYYVGLFTPKPSFEEFCAQGGCVLGLAPLAQEHETGLRAAIVLGYPGRAEGTMAHELAHTMGRAHAPCGKPAGVDEDFPYKGGGIGVFGFDLVKKKIFDPAASYRDLMGYCAPEWISDYTYRGLFERMEVVTKQAAAASAGGPPPELMRSFRVAADGTAVEGPEIEVLPDDGRGASVTVRYEGANGQVLATTRARARALSELGGSIVLAPQPPAAAVRARVGGLGLATLRPRAHVAR